MDDFLLRALLGGFGVALVAGPFGCFIVWRRLAYFGDTLAHAALLGISLGLWLEIDPILGVVGIGLCVALLLYLSERYGQLASDTVLGILSHTALALGLVAFGFMEKVRVDLLGYLFGDILAVRTHDLIWIYGGGVAALAVLLVFWRDLLAIAVNRDLARIDGVAVERAQLLFVALLALVVALMMKVVGLILVTSLLIIPAATARVLARTPESMAILAVISGWLAVGGGLWGSWRWDTPAGPSIVVAAALLFLLTGLGVRFRSDRR